MDIKQISVYINIERILQVRLIRKTTRGFVKYLFAHGNRAILEHFVWSATLLALDFDGTLSPIVSDPTWAGMHANTRRLLEAAAKRYPTAVISGRALADVRMRLRGTGITEVVGNHGLEPSSSTSRCAKEVRAWLPRLEEAVQSLPGVVLEDKTFSVALHYRKARRKKLACANLRAAISTLGDVRIIDGKQVINVVPIGAPHKGMALERLRAKLGCDTAIYVGDDETDEDVFSFDRQSGRLLSIRVGPKADSAADYFIRDQREIDLLLRTLSELRDKVGRRLAT